MSLPLTFVFLGFLSIITKKVTGIVYSLNKIVFAIGVGIKPSFELSDLKGYRRSWISSGSQSKLCGVLV